MISSSKSGPTPPPAAGSPSADHFDTFETDFFAAGDDDASLAIAAERYDAFGEPKSGSRHSPSRQFLLGLAGGTACIAVLGCVALWRSGAHASVDPQKPTAEPTSVPAPAPPPPPAADPAPAPAADPAPTSPTVAAAPPALPPAVTAPLAAPPPQAASAPAMAAVKAQEPVPVPAPAIADPDSARGACKQAISEKRAKGILSACAEAFAADPSATDLAIAVARTEFERGRTSQALTWGKKVVAVDPNAADAYVFIGGAEQSAGHTKAAREAYKRYLQLAPRGRYAADLRAIVGNL